MGIPTLLATNTITSGTGVSAFTSGIDSTYDEYMFVVTDAHPASNSQDFQVQFNASGGSGYDETITSTAVRARNNEDDTSSRDYQTSYDKAQNAGNQVIAIETENNADSSCAGILHLMQPSNTTFVKHFYSRFSTYNYNASIYDVYVSGYINTTTAITQVQFKFGSGNIDNAVIQMYGIG